MNQRVSEGEYMSKIYREKERSLYHMLVLLCWSGAREGDIYIYIYVEREEELWNWGMVFICWEIKPKINHQNIPCTFTHSFHFGLYLMQKIKQTKKRQKQNKIKKTIVPPMMNL